jgi:alpha-mannosidase
MVEKRGELALTLLRCVGKLSGRDLTTRPGGAAGWWNETPEAQCPGSHTFEYSVFPHKALGEAVWTSILEQVEEFTVPFLAVKRKNEQAVFEKSFLSVQPKALLLSALKEADDKSGVVLRLSNPVDVTVRGSVHLEAKVRAAFRVAMNEEVVEPIEILDGHDIPVTVKAFGVMTILVKF